MKFTETACNPIDHCYVCPLQQGLMSVPVSQSSTATHNPVAMQPLLMSSSNVAKVTQQLVSAGQQQQQQQQQQQTQQLIGLPGTNLAVTLPTASNAQQTQQQSTPTSPDAMSPTLPTPALNLQVWNRDIWDTFDIK